jgi:geranylgeranyl pyrophosphate synthase
LKALERNSALELTQARATEYAEAARTALDALDDSMYLDALRASPTYCIERDH